jgi:hypothetical protein
MTLLQSRSSLSVLVALAAGALSGGCTSASYAVKIDAMTKPDASTGTVEPQSYKITSKNPAMGDESLRYREATDFVKTALSSKGLYEAPSSEAADMIVELEYGIDAPRTKIETVSVPRYVQVGGGVRYEQVPVTDSRGNVSQRTVAVYQNPRSEFIGYDEMPQRVTVYEKYLRITARENKPAAEGRAPVQIWSVQSSTEDGSKDLRKYLPIMASATADYIGKGTTSSKVVKIKDPSQVVEFIRKGMNDSGSVAAEAPVERPKI